MGNPKKSEDTKIYLTPTIKMQLKIIAQRRGDTLTGLIRGVLVDYIEKTPAHLKAPSKFDIETD